MPPTTQKALLLERVNGEFYTSTRPVPKPAPGELLVKIQAFALNPVDYKIQHSNFFFMKHFPAVLGSDIAGDVEVVGEDVQGWAKGDRVFFQGNLADSDYAAFQQYALVPSDLAIKCPENTSYEQASNIPVAFMAAAYGLLAPEPMGAGLYDAQVKFSGSSAFVLGGSTSVGQYVIQLLKFHGFSQIIAYASGHQTQFLKSLGATDVIDRKKVPLDDLPVALEQHLTNELKITYDAVGSPETQQAGNLCTLPGGILISTMPHKTVDLGDFGKKFFNPMAVVYLPECREFGRVICGNLEEWLRTGVVIPSIVEALPVGLEPVLSGLERLRNNQVSGVKLVGRPDPV